LVRIATATFGAAEMAARNPAARKAGRSPRAAPVASSPMCSRSTSTTTPWQASLSRWCVGGKVEAVEGHFECETMRPRGSRRRRTERHSRDVYSSKEARSAVTRLTRVTGRAWLRCCLRNNFPHRGSSDRPIPPPIHEVSLKAAFSRCGLFLLCAPQRRDELLRPLTISLSTFLRVSGEQPIHGAPYLTYRNRPIVTRRWL